MSETTPSPGDEAATHHTVEAAVRHQLSKALGGRRGMLEAGVPTAVFTIVFLTTHQLRIGIAVSLACAFVLLVIRLVQRSSVQFVLNALVGIGIGAVFAWRAARGGGSSGDQALAYFLPGLIYNAAYAVVLSFTVLIRWPIVGFMVGSVAGDPLEWRNDARVVQLCGRLTWLLVAPCVVRVAVQGPMYLAGSRGWWSTDAAVAALGGAKLVMGWPLQVAAFAGMAWLLGRNHTPVQAGEPEPELGPAESQPAD